MENECENLKKLYKELINSDLFYFPSKGKIENATNELGVYIIFSPKNKVLHVGRNKTAEDGLNQRLYGHLVNGSSFSKNYLERNGQVLRTGYKFKYLIVQEARTRALLEALTAGFLCPSYIGIG